MTIGSVRPVMAAALLTALVGTLVWSLQVGEHPSREGDAARPAPHRVPPPFAIFRSLAPADAFGRVSLLRLEQPDAPRVLTGLSCLRVHYAGGRGLCVVQEQRGKEAEHVAYVFDRSFERGARIALGGVPTRVRVAPDGRRAAITTYAEEESPDGERLATESVIIDTRSGRTLAYLRQFRIDNQGFAAMTGPLDVSGVAFDRDGDRFFAAVSTSTERYLVSGSIDARRMMTVRTGVASESLSPDGHQLVVKKAGQNGFWQLAVIDLRTGSEHDLRHGARSVDDQVEWLDNAHVLYHDTDESGTGLWMLPTDGVSGPLLFVRDAYSGTVQR